MGKKESKKNKDVFNIVIIATLMFALIYVFAISLDLLERGNLEYHRGFHNIDLGHNLNTLQERFDTSLYDRTNLNTTVRPSELVITGINQMDSGFSKILKGYVLFTLLFAMLLFSTVFYTLRGDD